MAACIQVHVMHRCGLRLVANAWGVLTSNRTQSIPMAGRRYWSVYPEDPSRLTGLRWDNTLSKPTPWHPHFTHKKSKLSLWPHNRHRPAWVATGDVGRTSPTESMSTADQGQGAFGGRVGAHEGHLEIGMCRKLCEDGRVTDAVDALNFLVHRGCHVPNNLFYRVLKGCKDLVVGRHIHALTVQSGYEGDAFLATHLIGLYASHGRLKEAMRVFTQVATPDAYNWATIIFAYARHGQAAGAIRLYRRMRDSTTIKPTDCVYVAVLKACAAVGDLVAGKEVHAHILASPEKPNKFVETGLVNMYAKCGNLEDARSIFDKLPDRNVVTWTAMIAGYAEQGMVREALSLYSSMRQEAITPPNSVTFVCLLQACASLGVRTLHQGKEVHAQIEQRGLQDDVVVGASLVNMYAKCSSLEDARSVFDRLPDKNVVTWTAMIAGYAQQGMGQEALSLYSRMQQDGITPPDSVTFVCLLKACASVGVGAIQQGKQLHAQIKQQGMQDDMFVGCSLVNMYVKCGRLGDARSLFDRLADKNVTTWTTMIAGYAEHEIGQEALSLYSRMQQQGITPPDSVTFVCLLQACASLGVRAQRQGKQLHAQIEERGLQNDVVIGNSLVNMYAKCGSVDGARGVFDQLSDRNVVTWNTMLAGYAQHGMGEEALTLYTDMQQEGITPPDSITFLCLLQACASVGALHQGMQFHAQIEKRGLHDDVVLGGSLVNMYAKCGSLEDARSIFDRLPARNVVTWNAMIAGYAQQGLGQEALSIYRGMQQEGLTPTDSVAFVCLLQACASVGVGALDQGKHFHEQVEERGLQNDVVLAGCLVHMYAKCGSLEDARTIFDSLPARNVVTWTAMIAGYAEQGMGQEALSLYSRMQEEGLTPPHSATFVCLLQACALLGVGALDKGKQLHAQIEERGLQDDVVLGGSLVNMYAKCGSLDDARRVFDRLPARNVVTWTAMIAGYAEHGMGQEALSIYRSMQQEGVTPNSVTFVCLLQACAVLAALPLGKQLHAQIEDQGLQADVNVGGALVNMYAKCGSMSDSQQVFDSLPERAVEAWNALIGGYTRQGDSKVVFDLLDRMRIKGIQPDDITFLSVLTVCSHVGLVDKGRKYFEAMGTDYGIMPTVEHYSCMVDLLGRAGHLDEALQMAKTMPFPPNDVVWLTLLGACRKWNNVEIGKQAFEFAVGVDGKDASSYVLMSNIYAGAQMWGEAKEMQTRRVTSGAWKKPGQSWSPDMGGVVHTFVVGDKKHPESEGMYARL